ncbi:MAG TPA: CoA pyrophosphatase [Bacillales bacterium]|nr:CoA pyrophosphatase [Bacillales bacterium]
MVDIDKLARHLKNNPRNILGDETAMKSAVLIPLLQKDGEWHVLFEVRSYDLKRQPGEICFPGGRVEKQDQNDAETAVRETCEELQISRQQLELLGPLDILVQSQYFFVYPHVGVIHDYNAVLPNEEVAETFTVPLSWLAKHEPELHYLEMKVEPDQDFPFELIPNGKNYDWRGRSMPEYFYLYENRIIWGLTARILRHFLKMVS